MNNQLIEHIRALNIREKAEIDQRRKAALNRIKQLREQLKEKQNARNVICQ